jgi:hypothetical protein
VTRAVKAKGEDGKRITRTDERERRKINNSEEEKDFY